MLLGRRANRCGTHSSHAHVLRLVWMYFRLPPVGECAIAGCRFQEDTRLAPRRPASVSVGVAPAVTRPETCPPLSNVPPQASAGLVVNTARQLVDHPQPTPEELRPLIPNGRMSGHTRG